MTVDTLIFHQIFILTCSEDNRIFDIFLRNLIYIFLYFKRIQYLYKTPIRTDL